MLFTVAGVVGVILVDVFFIQARALRAPWGVALARPADDTPRFERWGVDVVVTM